MDPESVLRLLHTLGGRVARVLVVGCQPAVVDEGMQLSAPVREALDEAVRTVARLANREAALLDAADGVADARNEETARA
jgi:hydrogenase maturation protease